MALVLVVEDEDVLREMLAELVEESGHRPLTAANGREALAVLHDANETPGLVISDVMMPQMNGINFAQALRADPRFEHVPLILMSAGVLGAIDNVANRFVSKPFDIEAIENLIAQYVG